MKRRAISLITVLALCLGLCPVRALAADDKVEVFEVKEDRTNELSYEVSNSLKLDTKGNSYTVKGHTAFIVTGTGRLYLTFGTIESTNGAGIEVLTGGFLRVDQAGMTVIGTTYGLNIVSGATVELSGGTFTGKQAAINAENFKDLLVSGYAYFDESGKPIPLTEVAKAKTVKVKECTNHVYSYTARANVPTHDGTCDYCGAKVEAVPCTFSFDADGTGVCADCGRTIEIEITIDKDALIYDGTPRPESASVAVTLDGDENKTLNEDTDFKVEKTTGVNAGEIISVTVTGVTYNGSFTKEYSVAKAQPKISWDSSVKNPNKTYDGEPIDEAALLQKVIIDAPKAEELKELIYFTYAKSGSSVYTDGLPTDVGTYQIKANLPETDNYLAASSSGTAILYIYQIDPIMTDPPTAKELEYNGAAQKLVTGGTLNPDAVGAVVEFATSENGPWSTDIPTGTNAGDYEVWYKVEGTNNYKGVEPTQITITIQPKKITPVVVLEYYTTVYDGGYKQPKVTVKDGETVLPAGEYTVTYVSNQNVGTAKVIVSDNLGGNYTILPNNSAGPEEPEGFVVTFEITAKDQDALTITNRPNSVVYGDVFTLETSGGSGNGPVTWEIVNGTGIAKVAAGGQITVTGVGEVTVRATKSDGNHKDAIAEWTFTAQPKQVTAVVTAKDKTYNGNANAEITAEVPVQDIVSGDTITITGLTGTFSNANAGTGKIVTVTGGTVNGKQITNGVAEIEKYIVTIPATTTADITKAATRINTRPSSENLTLIYNRNSRPLLANGAITGTTDVLPDTANLTVEYARSANGPWDTTIPEATDAGSYEVWYRVRESGNYFGTAAECVVVTISPKTVSNPVITLPSGAEYDYVYDGTEKKPAVTVKYTENNEEIVIPASEYTVTYSNNINAGKNATVTVTDKDGGNYTFEKQTKAFEITTVGNAVLTSAPQANDLTYNGSMQNLVTPGEVTGGHLVYALKNTENAPAENEYTPTIPQEKDAGTYTVYYKVVGDGNHNDISTVFSVSVTIQPKTVSSPVIELPAESFTYNDSAQTFTDEDKIIVKDSGVTIDPGEYTIDYSNNINAGMAAVHIVDKSGGNYIVNGTAYFTIKKADIVVAEADKPKGKTGLQYTGTAQELLETRGSSQYGTMVYSLDGIYYSEAIPTGTAVKTYTVYYKVLGDSNHKDSADTTISVSIAKNTVNNPKIILSSKTFRYNGSQQKPTVTVRDDKGLLIAENEYVVTITGTKTGGALAVDVDTYTVTITTQENSNYIITSNNTATYQIAAAEQEAISITGTRDQVYYGDTIQLGITGGTGSGTVTWKVEAKTGTTTNEISEGGLLTIKETGSFVVTATRKSTSGNYADISTTWEFSVNPKPVTAVVTAANKVFDGTTVATLTVTVPGTDLTITGVTGAFADTNVGTGKTVTIDSSGATASNSNYDVTYPDTATADITPKPISPTVTVTPVSSTYTGSAITPTVTVIYTDTEGNLTLQPTDYTVEYSDNINVGTATVTVKNVDGGNYTINAVEHFTIEKADVTDVTAPTGKTGLVYSGTAQKLIDAGSSPHGTMMYSLDGENYYENIPTGTDAKTYTVYYKVQGDSNHNNSTPVLVAVTIKKAKQTQLTITGIPSGTVYYDDSENGDNNKIPLDTTGGSGNGTVSWSIEEGGTIAEIGADTGLLVIKGVGEVEVKATRTADNYEDAVATWTFTVYSASLPGVSVTPKTLTYNGGAQALVEVDGDEDKTLLYSVNGGDYGTDIPTGENAGTYIVWYKMQGDDNHVGSVTVTIAKAIPKIVEQPTATPIKKGQTLSNDVLSGGKAIYGDNDDNVVSGKFTWKFLQAPWVSVSLPVIFTPEDTDNFEIVELMVLAKVEESSTTDSTSTPSTETASVETTVRDGTASTVMNSAAGDELVDEAVANESERVVIKPEITGDVTKTEVSLPASAVGRLGSETDASLIISTPVADVTIPNGALKMISGAGDTVSVVTERVDNTVVLTLTADGKEIGDIPGGLTLTVPMGNTGPGTVAVLVYEDGTRETIRWSAAVNGSVRIPLDGSAAVEIVDNSKEFKDVAGENWEANAVAFASAHELFIGTGEATFSPELTMSRGMLVTVLYNLEGKPDQELTDGFSDVGSDVWCAAGVSWAVANGVVSGHEDGRFGPDDDMTREQLAVMLWRYMGSPETDVQALDFLDADQVGSDAVKALCWAVANGVLRGHGDGRLDPGGVATRAQAAQMLKNLIENS